MYLEGMAPSSTLVHLRWLAVVCQLLLVAATEVSAPGTVAWLPVVLLILAVAGSNLVLDRWQQRDDVAHATAASVLVLDIVGLTGVLALALGPSNPFTALYIVTVAIGAMVLPAAWTAGLVVVAVVAYGALFVAVPMDEHAHHTDMATHLAGMWVAFAVAAPFVAYALARLRGALQRQAVELATVRETAARQQKLAALATLATGAAHELNTPLSTIAVAARELERTAPEAQAADAALIRQQVERCTDILRQLAVQTGQPSGSQPRAVGIEQLVRSACEGLDMGPDVQLQLGSDEVCVPEEAVARALRGLIDNALDASPPDRAVVVRTVRSTDADLELSIEDEGAGIPAELLGRVGEPFFTTKGNDGMGLGVFYARSLLEQIGGALTLSPRQGGGTVASVVLPRRVS
jgi:two-component system sensor histidine kinase RegB